MAEVGDTGQQQPSLGAARRREVRIQPFEVLPDTLDAYGRSADILTPELLRRLAVDEGRSARDIARRTGFSTRTVLTHLHVAGLPARPRGVEVNRRRTPGSGGAPGTQR